MTHRVFRRFGNQQCEKHCEIVSKYDRVTYSADRPGKTPFSLIGQISLKSLRQIYIGYLELRPKTCDNVKLVQFINRTEPKQALYPSNWWTKC